MISLEILEEWNPWWNREFKYNKIKRDYLNKIIPWIDRREIISIVGVRRAGKTTLMYEIIDYLINHKKIKPNCIFFIKADDDRIISKKLIDESLELYRISKNPDKEIFLFIDEIQEIDNWNKTVKRIYDLNPEIKIILTGSNSSVIREELGSLLAGRFSYFELFPFSFKEFLMTKENNESDMDKILKNRYLSKNYLEEFLLNGAYPEIVLEKNKELKDKLIKYYFDAIFYRDIIKRKSIRNPSKMEKLVKFCLQNISSLISYNKIGKILNLSSDSVGEYILIMENAYLLFPINIFEFSYKKQIVNPKKIYCVDNGIRNIVGFKFKEDFGKLYENAIFIELRKTGFEIYYFKEKGECDFIVKNKKNLFAIQACYDLSDESTLKRETNSLLEAMNSLKIKKGLIINETYEKIEKINGKTIQYTPLWKWLLIEKRFE